MKRSVIFLICISFLISKFGFAQNCNTDTTTFNRGFIANELDTINRVLNTKLPVRILNIDPSPEKIAQEVVLKDSAFLQYIINDDNDLPYRNEIFTIERIRESDLTEANKLQCANQNCYRVEMYNFGIDVSSRAIVDITAKKVISVQHLRSFQPNIPLRLKMIALKIALESPEVKAELGYDPTEEDALMVDTKTSLNKSKCQRSKHLCVAPTFVKGDRALWCIVDLTDFKLVGVRWTNVGYNPFEYKERFSERKLQNDNITDCFCTVELPLNKGDWKLNYMITSSDGMRVSDVYYKNTKILESAKLVDWHVSYSNTDGFGYSDAVGCPYFSTAAVLAIDPPKIMNLVEGGKKIGFVIEQNFFSEGWPLPCNYNYCQRFEFYDDGRFRIACASLGRGCGNNGTYRPVTRIAFSKSYNKFYEWSNATSWMDWKNEQYKLQNELTEYDKHGFQYKISDKNSNGYYLMPSIGQFNDGGRGDNAWVYVTKWHENIDEGDTELPTIGPCCNTDYRQGPEKFIEPTPENLDDAPFVLWYVSQVKNDNTKGHEYCWAEPRMENGIYVTDVYPCFSGPMFFPIVDQNK